MGEPPGDVSFCGRDPLVYTPDSRPAIPPGTSLAGHPSHGGRRHPAGPVFPGLPRYLDRLLFHHGPVGFPGTKTENHGRGFPFPGPDQHAGHDDRCRLLPDRGNPAFLSRKRRQDPFLRPDDPSMRPQDPSLQPQDSFYSHRTAPIHRGLPFRRGVLSCGRVSASFSGPSPFTSLRPCLYSSTWVPTSCAPDGWGTTPICPGQSTLPAST